MSEREHGKFSVHFIGFALVVLVAAIAMTTLTALLVLYDKDLQVSSATPATPVKLVKRSVEEQFDTAVHEAGHALLCVALLPGRQLVDILVYEKYDEADGKFGLTHDNRPQDTEGAAAYQEKRAEVLYYLGGAAAEEAVFTAKPKEDGADQDAVGDLLLAYCSAEDGSQCGTCSESDLIGNACMVKNRIAGARTSLYAEALAIAKLNRELLVELANELMRQPVHNGQRLLSGAQLQAFFLKHPVQMPEPPPASKTP